MRLLMTILWLGAALLAAPGAASATQQELQELPRLDFGCLTCHAGSGVTASSVPAGSSNSFNAFGQAWLEWRDAGKAWDKDFALRNDDGDGCSNGFELGDPGGDWRPGLPRPEQAGDEPGNPGDPGDCALPINEDSWGVLKSLFGS